VKENVPVPGCRQPVKTLWLQLLGLESNAPVSEVTLWGEAPWLLHITVVPAGTVSVWGAKAKSTMDTDEAAQAGPAVNAKASTAALAALATATNRRAIR
jgi:hypothetical protein